MKRLIKYLLIMFAICLITSTISIEFIDNIKYSFLAYTEEPINIKTGLVNNKYFEIDSNGKEADKTLNGINNAIQYARKNNITYIQFEKGDYLINTEGNGITNSSIIVESNMKLNFNGSNILCKTSQRTSYALIRIIDKENISVQNAILQGDRDTHDYSKYPFPQYSHEYGHGIIIGGSENIKIENIVVKKMIGDGIYITNQNEKNSMNIKIR